MKKNKIEKVLILALILLIILVTIIVSQVRKNKEINNNNTNSESPKIENKNNEEVVAEPIENIDETTYEYVEDTSLKEIENFSQFIEVSDCIEKYNTLLNVLYSSENMHSMFTEDTTETNKTSSGNSETIKKIYNMLDKSYIDYYNINNDNLKSKINYGSYQFSIDKIYVQMEKETNVCNHIVFGKLINNGKSITDYTYIVRIDLKDGDYSIIPNDYINDRKISTQNLSSMFNNEIEKNENNDVKIIKGYQYQYAVAIFNEYKKKMLYDQEKAYNILNKTYVSERFENEEDFEKYVSNNERSIRISSITNYKTEKKEDGLEIIIFDQYDNYYRIEAKTPTNYEVFLDNCTLESEEYKNKYNRSSNEEKAKMIVGRIQNLINADNYHLLYKKLNEIYRSNNIKDEEFLQTLIEANIYDKNTFIIEKKTKNGENYIVKCGAQNKKNDSFELRHITFVIHLKENNDFEFSFSV